MNQRGLTLKILEALVAVVAVGGLLFAATRLPRNSLIGKWTEIVAPAADPTQPPVTPLLLEFTEGGKMIFHSTGTAVELDFQFLTESALNVPAETSVGIPANTVLTYTIVNSQLNLNIGGQELVFNRTP